MLIVIILSFLDWLCLLLGYSQFNEGSART